MINTALLLEQSYSFSANYATFSTYLSALKALDMRYDALGMK
jgi:hypothetical protein